MQYLKDTSDLIMQRGAEISDCGTYRYRLWREWDRARPTLAFLMLNPSTADHLADDQTVTRCMSRAIAAGFGRLEVANLFPLRATDPGELLTHARSARATQHGRLRRSTERRWLSVHGARTQRPRRVRRS